MQTRLFVSLHKVSHIIARYSSLFRVFFRFSLPFFFIYKSVFEQLFSFSVWMVLFLQFRLQNFVCCTCQSKQKFDERRIKNVCSHSYLRRNTDQAKYDHTYYYSSNMCISCLYVNCACVHTVCMCMFR